MKIIKKYIILLTLVIYAIFIFRLCCHLLEKFLKNKNMDHVHNHADMHNHGDVISPYNNGHDHNHGDEDNACSEHSMHAMVFHTSLCQDILFSGWNTQNVLQMLGSCVIIFIFAILYEFLRSYRDVLFTKGAEGQTQSQINITKQECGPNSSCSNQKIVRYTMLSTMHIVQTFLHILQVFMSYLLMLIFMTYNVWLCIALILGTGIGYYLFAWKKQTVIDLTEHCH